MKAFVESSFNYCPLIWMFHSRKLNNKINRIHGRALRTVYSGYNSSLVIEICKQLRGLSPATLSEVFKVNETMRYDNIICKKSKDSKIQYRNYIFHVSKQQSSLLVFSFEIHITCCSFFYYLFIIFNKNQSIRFVLTFRIHRQLTLIGFTLYSNSYVKVNKK